MIVTARVAEGGFQKLDICSSDTKEAFDIGVLSEVLRNIGIHREFSFYQCDNSVKLTISLRSEI
jgi:hypothetical protein